MTPKFAQLVDPVFLEVFSTIRRLTQGSALTAEDVRTQLGSLIKTVDERLRRGDQDDLAKSWQLAKYALVGWIDDLFTFDFVWSNNEPWKPLEQDLYASSTAGENFFSNAAEAAKLTTSSDALETYYVCFMMGFRGELRDNPAREEEARRWVRTYGELVKQRRDSQQAEQLAEAGSSRARINTATPLWNRHLVTWPWTLVATLAALNVLVLLND
jgi:type IV/VI secretion system ImpK/VasF family protein